MQCLRSSDHASQLMSVRVITTESACPWHPKQTHYLNQSRKRSAYLRLPQTKIVQARGPAALVSANLKRSKQDHLLTSNMKKDPTRMKTGNTMKTHILILKIRCLAKKKRFHLLSQKKVTLRISLEGCLLYQAFKISNCVDRPQRYS